MPPRPGPSGLYDPATEHDSCGVAFVVDLSGRPSHDVIQQAVTALRHLDHRGATGAEDSSGDGAGVLLQVPDALLRRRVGFPLPPAGSYAVGTAFLPTDADDRAAVLAGVARLAAAEGLRVLGWRDVPVDPTGAGLGRTAAAAMPRLSQLFLAGTGGQSGLELDRLAYCLRRRAERSLPVYFASLSARTLVYKGMLTTAQLVPFFPDLADPALASAMALVHSRFSTNTFPSWPLAHPFRYVAHNGEINTIRGNRNWMAAREALLASDLLPGDLRRLFPVCTPGASDSASFDEVLELLHLGGRSLPHAVLMMIPEAWQQHAEMDARRRAFYEFHASLMEPWDGPACVSFTDGTVIGAVLDRNGLRPARWWLTDDGLVVFASETGVLDLPGRRVVRKGRVAPGRMFLADVSRHRIVEDDEIKAELAAEHPYGDWLDTGLLRLEELPAREHRVYPKSSVLRRQRTFGYTAEELRTILAPMVGGEEPVGSMGSDTPPAVLSTRPRLLFDHFTQLFAQVTNPPLDAIREELVTSLAATVGPEQNLLSAGPASCRQLVLPFPVLDNDELAKVLHINDDGDLPGFACVRVHGLFPVAAGAAGLGEALERACAEVDDAVAAGARLVVLSDRDSDAAHAPVPSLLLTAAVHHHLVARGLRARIGLLVEAGDVREVHHVALLLGYGAAAVNPYLAMETIEEMVRAGDVGGVEPADAVRRYIRALGKGVLKVMSKMGVSTVASYTGAQLFETLGLGRDLVDRYFPGTTSRLGGIGLAELAGDVLARHRSAYPDVATPHRSLPVGGEYQWRREGELHLFDPETVFRLQHSTRSKRFDLFRRYTDRVDDSAARLLTLRGLLRFAPAEAVPLAEVEPVERIVRRFATGAMSYGSISAEAHETLAVAMNRLGGRSNTGEGGEDPERLRDPARRSAIKQVASARFGVTSDYLVHAEEIQIKMAQGAKPGEGGQLPGPKVYPWIARTRHSTPGVGLISPPPHHDIYSIEDLAQLIHDLRCANPSARISVKLVAELGVGTVAAGVAKAGADVVLISGGDGGTGAAPLTSLKHAGAPWELGLAETQQTLRRNGLRDRVVVQTDGQLRTGRDVVVAALLGAEEYGFATAPLVVSGCVMMRVCHLDTCPVGIATQDPVLRERFSGRPEFVETFFTFLAEQVREHLAALGLRSLDEAVGRVDLLDPRPAVDHWRASGLDLAPLLEPGADPAVPRRSRPAPRPGPTALERELLDACAPALAGDRPVRHRVTVRNTDRAVGTRLGAEVTRRHGPDGLPSGTIELDCTGSAGQSFGAFLPAGITLRLRGDANDYVGKGLSGGRLVLRPEEGLGPDSVLLGNVALYGATSGHAYLAGTAGERFAVRNSGAVAVVEGVGDHGCEYMTGGRVAVLGPTGRNFGAGMSGGLAYLLDAEPLRVNRTLVDLRPLADGEDAELAGLLAEHREQTGSPAAAALLADWPAASRRFTTVAPKAPPVPPAQPAAPREVVVTAARAEVLDG